VSAAVTGKRGLIALGGRAGGIGRAAGVTEDREKSQVAQQRPGQGSALPLGGKCDGDGAGKIVGATEVCRQDGLRGWPNGSPESFEGNHTSILVTEWIRSGALGVLIGVGDGAVQQISDPPVKPDIDPTRVSVVGVGELALDGAGAGEWISHRKGAGRRHREIVLVVRRDVQHHVVTECVSNPELKQDRLPEIQISPRPIEIDAIEHQAEVWRLYLMGVGQTEVRASGHRKRDLNMGTQVSVADVGPRGYQWSAIC